uniref:Uncharacterized protein n=1 Tax=Physcomitrium patens TaxID=3218 RepID=A0A2K1INH6_PHYPA|nr:hypothetical protein PHYPA_027147 [Physcomitrium patens]
MAVQDEAVDLSSGTDAPNVHHRQGESTNSAKSTDPTSQLIDLKLKLRCRKSNRKGESEGNQPDPPWWYALLTVFYLQLSRRRFFIHRFAASRSWIRGLRLRCARHSAHEAQVPRWIADFSGLYWDILTASARAPTFVHTSCA